MRKGESIIIIILLFVIISCSIENIKLSDPFIVKVKIEEGICNSLEKEYQPTINVSYDKITEFFTLQYKDNTNTLKKICLYFYKGLPRITSNTVCNYCSNKSENILECDTQGYYDFSAERIGVPQYEIYKEITPPCKRVNLELTSRTRNSVVIYVDKLTLVSNNTVIQSLEDCKPEWEQELYPDVDKDIGFCFRSINVGDKLYFNWQDKELKNHQTVIKID